MHSFLILGSLFCTGIALAQNHDDGALSAKTPLVQLYTNEGLIEISVDANTPVTTQNFLSYAKSGFYNGTIFHRVIDNFMIQGGGLLPDMHEKTPSFPPIKNEGSQCGKNTRGSVAMARTSDPDSATSQFFINVADNSFLDFKSESVQAWGYCVFGHVVKGMDVVDKIKSVATTARDGYQDVPVQPVIIQRVEVAQ